MAGVVVAVDPADVGLVPHTLTLPVSSPEHDVTVNDHVDVVRRAAVTVTDPRRLAVPTTVICTSLPSPVLRQLADAGQIPTELPAMSNVRYVDLPTGHWPMLSTPAALGAALLEETRRV